MSDEGLAMNGVDGASGEYLEPPRALDAFLQHIEAQRNAHLTARVDAEAGTYGLPPDVNPLDLREAGWALVTHADEPEIRDALAPLIEHRRTMSDRVRLLTYSGQTSSRWLAEQGVGVSDLLPSIVPYYLLIAGNSSRIPFRFVHELGVDYAVGRLELDTADDYRRYAEQLIAHESRAPRDQHTVEVFGPRHDPATKLSADRLLTPLAAEFATSKHIGESATKATLRDVLAEPPDILFTASHGVAFAADDLRQKDAQGALLCHDWPGPGAISADHYFAAADVPSRDLTGMIAFHFACFGGGTPEKDRFFKRADGPAKTLAPAPFIAALPKQLLRNGAIAVTSHVDRAWGYSIASSSAKATEIAPFRNFLTRVLSGEPVGHAMRDFADRFAKYSVLLSAELERAESEDVPAKDLVELWTQRNDAEAYVVIGDPAAHL
ncbi:MAG TPA: hypothetical protein VJZ00_16035 [Thermoanaerobaculia bacterium]|nr:hypothetical protein [Thermoanaerobaculia bacterium]